MRKRSEGKKRENRFLYHLRAAINYVHIHRIKFTEDLRKYAFVQQKVKHQIKDLNHFRLSQTKYWWKYNEVPIENPEKKRNSNVMGETEILYPNVNWSDISNPIFHFNNWVDSEYTIMMTKDAAPHTNTYSCLKNHSVQA